MDLELDIDGFCRCIIIRNGWKGAGKELRTKILNRFQRRPPLRNSLAPCGAQNGSKCFRKKSQ